MKVGTVYPASFGWMGRRRRIVVAPAEGCVIWEASHMLCTIFNYKLHLSLDRDEVQTPTRHPKLGTILFITSYSDKKDLMHVFTNRERLD